MRDSYTKRNRLDRAEQKIGARPNADAAEELQRAVQIIDNLGFLKSCGCDAAGEALKMCLALSDSMKEKDGKKLAAINKKLVTIDKQIDKWIEANPNPEPLPPDHGQPESTQREFHA